MAIMLVACDDVDGLLKAFEISSHPWGVKKSLDP